MPSQEVKDLLALIDGLLSGSGAPASPEAALKALGHTSSDPSDRRVLAERLLSLARERVTARQQLLQVAQLAELGLASAELIHELRQPLSGIAGFTQLLVGEPAGESSGEWLAEVLVQTQRMEQMIDRLRRFSRPSLVSDLPSQPNVAVREAASLFPLLPPLVQLELELTEGLPLVRGEVSRLVQVFSNLIANARDAVESHGGGTVKVKSTPVAGGVEVMVADDGGGIPPSVRERLFEPFQSTKGEKGTGLGLYICREILREAGAELVLLEQPPPPFRTAFVVRLLAAAPRGTTPAPQGAIAAAARPPLTSHVERLVRRATDQVHAVPRVRRVLLVDDESSLRRMLRVVLSREPSIDLHEAESAEAARQLLERERFDVVIADRLLPGAGGLEVIRHAKDHDPLVESLLVTGSPSLDSAIEALELGVTDYLMKPFEDVAALRRTLTLLVEKTRLAHVAARLAERIPGWAEELADALRIGDTRRSPALELALNELGRATPGSGPRVALVGEQGAADRLTQAAVRFEPFVSTGALQQPLGDGLFDVVILSGGLSLEESLAMVKKARAARRPAQVIWAAPIADFHQALQLLRTGVSDVLGEATPQQLSARVARAYRRRRDEVRLRALDEALALLGVERTAG